MVQSEERGLSVREEEGMEEEETKCLLSTMASTGQASWPAIQRYVSKESIPERTAA